MARNTLTCHTLTGHVAAPLGLRHAMEDNGARDGPIGDPARYLARYSQKRLRHVVN